MLNVVTIDGPAGAGKSTVARLLAARLGDAFLDTGSMYRAAVLAAMHAGLDIMAAADDAIETCVAAAEIDVRDGRTWLGSDDVTAAVRSADIAPLVRFTADHPGIRARMVTLQRSIVARDNAAGRGVITEGRDQGTEVFPNAVCKFFVTASIEVRARRRQEELRVRGEIVDIALLQQEIATRDHRDENRAIAPLRRAADAVLVETDTMTINDVVKYLAAIVIQARNEQL